MLPWKRIPQHAITIHSIYMKYAAHRMHLKENLASVHRLLRVFLSFTSRRPQKKKSAVPRYIYKPEKEDLDVEQLDSDTHLDKISVSYIYLYMYTSQFLPAGFIYIERSWSCTSPETPEGRFSSNTRSKTLMNQNPPSPSTYIHTYPVIPHISPCRFQNGKSK